jgi:hypothetical protein
VTGTVESVPLIAASVMSKKLAEGGNAILLDVKCGDGAFMKSPADAEALARAMVAIGTHAGVRTEAFITEMDAPLGRSVGNALEIRECLDLLRGKGPADLTALVARLATRMVMLGGAHPTRPARARRSIGRWIPARRSTCSSGWSNVRAAIRGSSTTRRCCRRRRVWRWSGPRGRAWSARSARWGWDAPATCSAPVARAWAKPLTTQSACACWSIGAERVGEGDPLAELHHRAGLHLDEAIGPVPGGDRSGRWMSPTATGREPGGQCARRSDSRGGAMKDDAPVGLPPQVWGRADLFVLGGLAAVAGAAILLGTMGMSRLQPIAGLAVILALAYSLSSARHAIDRRTVAWGLGLQFLFAVVVLKTDAGRAVFQTAGSLITRLLNFTYVGSSFVFGPLGNPEVWPRVMTGALGAEGAQYASVFAFQVLPTIIFIAALFAMLYYFGVMQLIVRLFAVIMRRFMRASGAESLNVAASIFMGQTEAPLTIRPFLSRMTESELMTVMTAGMAHISGGVMAAYILFGVEAQHLLTAVIMTAPAR